MKRVKCTGCKRTYLFFEDASTDPGKWAVNQIEKYGVWFAEDGSMRGIKYIGEVSKGKEGLIINDNGCLRCQ